MSRSWKLQDARECLSEVIAQADREGLQVILRDGSPAAVVLSIADFEKLSRSSSLPEFLGSLPWKGTSIELERDQSLAREVEF